MAEATGENLADVIENQTKREMKLVKLKTTDGTEFEVEEAITKEFSALKPFIEEVDYSDSPIPIPIPIVPADVLVKIIEYCRKKCELDAKAKPLDSDNVGGNRTCDIKAFGEAFVRDMTNQDIKELAIAANYLDIKDLLNFLCECIADRIKNRSVEYVRAFFGVENDYTEEEEAALREQNAWAFDGVDED